MLIWPEPPTCADDAAAYLVLQLNAWLRGVGNASCGQDVDTLPEYCVPPARCATSSG